MALDFTNATSNRVNHGSGATLDNLDPLTCVGWYYVVEAANARRFWSKGPDGNDRNVLISGADRNIQLSVARASTALSYITNDSPLVNDTWNFVATVLDTSAATQGRIYRGDLITQAVESTYGTATNGSGALNDDASGDLHVGNFSTSSTVAFSGLIGVFAYVGAALPLAEIQMWQRRPVVLANMVLLCRYGKFGVGPQRDLSGHGNNGVVTGATAEVDLLDYLFQPLDPYHLWWVPSAAAAGHASHLVSSIPLKSKMQGLVA